MLKKFCDVCEKEMPDLDSGCEIDTDKPPYPKQYVCSLDCAVTFLRAEHGKVVTINNLDYGNSVFERRAEWLFANMQNKTKRSQSIAENANRILGNALTVQGN